MSREMSVPLSAFRFFRRAYPLTLFGSLALALAVALLSASLAEKNSLGVIVATLALVLVFFFCVVSAAQALRARSASFSLVPADPLRRGENSRAFALMLSDALLPVVRFHAALSGTLELAARPVYWIRADFRVLGGDDGESFPFTFPLHGLAMIGGSFRVGDILGIASVFVADIPAMSFAVLPRPLAGVEVTFDRQSLSESTQSLRKTSGHERLLVREYAPGDLVRDINWKAAAKLGSLLTRIPPESPRETLTIRLVIVMPQEGLSAASRARALVECAHVGSLTVSFMYAARARYPDCAFAVCLGGADFDVSPEDSLDVFFAALSRASFSPGGRDDVARIPEGAWVIGCASDARLARVMVVGAPSAPVSLLSRFTGFVATGHDADVFFVPAFSPFPDALFLRAWGSARACVQSRVVSHNGGSARIAGPEGATVFDCGVSL
jgi:uncharacterized protein (DUF58 family)